ncbi:Alcohol dehydrogenase zinc-binding domain protein [Caldithrix abyssi DSM 13497]|uniref:Alcohol dehydrogenase zinc-binding domain protein n=2 Tax=Caldithrix abyssi DSM 13497 TaxID=880073 RepID=H1XSR8_CALAY|nr:medium chain dehydrogenase/reductase family protein [Caldithrix abyssi]EHO40295.1 Alcohol dehydrogenase zinc-binding domain protein [Caldithrix abyssi DSM 13497]
MSYKRVVVTRYGGPEVLRVIEENKLPEPGPGEVRVKVLATSAAFTDVMIRKGKYPGIKVKPPFTPGYDMVGVVDRLGPGVARVKTGQQVAALTIIGAYSEYLCLSENCLTPVPAGLDPAEAVSLVLSYVTAYQMLHRVAKAKRGQRILIHGAGGAVGTALLQLGGLMGLKMYGTASSAKHDLVKRLGATPIDYVNEDFEERIRSLTGAGVDIVFDAIGGDHFKRSFDVLQRGGKLVAYGFYNAVLGRGGSIPLDFIRLQLWNCLPNGKSTAFYSIGSLYKKKMDWFTEDLRRLFELLVQNRIKPVIAARMPLTDVVRAHELLERAEISGKIVLNVSSTAG